MSILTFILDRALTWTFVGFAGATFSLFLIGLPLGIVERPDLYGPASLVLQSIGAVACVAWLEVAIWRSGRGL